MNTSKLIRLSFSEFLHHKWRLFAYSLSISVGIAALFATGSLKNDLLFQIDNETRTLVGGDLVVKGFATLPDSLKDKFKEVSSRQAVEKSFASMVVFSENGQSRLVNVRAISSAYPLVGEIEDELGNSANLKSESNRVSIHQSLKQQFNLKLGDTVHIGNSNFQIAAFHIKAPGQTGIAATVAPTVFMSISDLEKTGLIRKGSRIRNSYYYEIGNGKVLDRTYKSFKKPVENMGMRIENLDAGKQRLGRAYSNLFRFLNLAAFIALVLGGVGIGSAIDLFLAEKKKMVAVLKCLGFEYRQIAVIFLFQISLLGAFGSFTGIVLGSFFQRLMPIVFEAILIEEVKQFFHWEMVGVALIAGLLIGLLFGLKTLLPLFKATPMMALRAHVSEQKSFLKTEFAVRGIQLVVIFLLSWYLANDWLLSVFFCGLLVFVMLVLSGVALLLRSMSRKFGNRLQSFEWKYAFSALYRPQNQTILLIGTIGLSVILVLHLFFIRSSLVSTIQVSGDDNRPNLIIFDIDKESVKPIEVYLEENSARVFAPLAIVPMRMHALKGRSVFNWKEDSTHEIPNHVFDREYRVTERGELGENETLLEGEWTGEKTGNRIPISLEENFSEQAELSIGDEVDFNVFGSILKTRVAAIRQVDFTQMREAFTIVFPKGSLEGAPVMYAVSANIPEHINRAEIQNGLINRFRNISVIDLDLVFESISQVTSKIELAIQFMFSFSALTALVVLLNSLFISRFQRLKENATLRTLGAISKNLTRINVYEFFIIGMLAVATGLIISLLISFALLVWLFKVKFAPEMGFSAILLFCTLLLVVVMGVLNSRSLVNVAPMRILKGNE